MADKFLNELNKVNTLTNEDLLLISKKVSEDNYSTEYATVADLSSHVSTELSGDLNDHINETNVAAENKKHVTSNERKTWTDAANAINNFLSGADNAAKAIDTLKEIQEWFDNDENGTAASILSAISTLQEENTELKKKLEAYDTRFGYTADENGNVNWTVNFLKINSPEKKS